MESEEEEKEEDEEEEEEDVKEGDRGRETPRGSHTEVIRMGGDEPPPRRKTLIYLTLPQNVHTCCCRESMETNCITIMGRT